MLKNRRKLFLFGKYSLALLPPKRWLTELGIKQGDYVELEFDRKRKRVVIKFTDDSASTEDATKPDKKTDSQSNVNNPKNKNSEELITEKEVEDWESIPEL